ncbi:MAG: recombinase family protein [Sporolactobacillus sp.]
MSIQNKSNQIKDALRKSFKEGTSKLAYRKCYGYRQTPDGALAIVPQEAEVVVWIFEHYLSGSSFGKIAKALEAKQILSPSGNSKWNREAISKLLSNEKYIGNVLLQKTVSFAGYQMKNEGDVDQVLIQSHHPAIISPELFEAVQSEKLERSQTADAKIEMTLL